LRRAVLERAVREVADALDELRTAAQRIDSARQSRDLAQELLTAEEKSFRLGRSDSLDVLNAQAALATAEREELRARTAYATALAALYAVRGDLIEKKGVQTPR
jgi:outer membrane protein TolC